MSDLSKQKLARAVTVRTDENGKIVESKAVLQNGLVVRAAGPMDLRVGK